MTTTHWLLLVIALLWIFGAYLMSYLGFAGDCLIKRKGNTRRVRPPMYWFSAALVAWPFILIFIIFFRSPKRK